MIPQKSEDQDNVKQQVPQTGDPSRLSLSSRHSLRALLMTLLAGHLAISAIFAAIWTFSTQQDFTKRANERSLKISRNIVSDLNNISQKIVAILNPTPFEKDPNPSTTAPHFENIVADLDGLLDAHLFQLDSRNVIKRVSRPKDAHVIGNVFDEGSKIPFTTVQNELLISGMLPSLDAKTPLFEWRKKFSSGSYVLQVNINEFWTWCKQLSLGGEQDVFVSLVSSSSHYFRADCTPHKDQEGLWKAFQNQSTDNDLQSTVSFQDHNYVISVHQPDIFPVKALVFIKIPSKKDLLSQNSVWIYSLFTASLGLLLMIFRLFRTRISEHVQKIHAITSTPLSQLDRATHQETHSPEFGLAFAGLRSMQDALDSFYIKNSIKTKFATDLAAFHQPDDLMRKATELLATQTRADSCFFLPATTAQGAQTLKSWAWTRHSVQELAPTDEAQVRATIASQIHLEIRIKKDSGILGEFFLLTPKLPDKSAPEVAQAVIDVIQNNLERNKAHWREAVRELEKKTAQALLASHMPTWQIEKPSYHIASFYNASATHTGEFFYVISSPQSDDFFFITGGPSAAARQKQLDDSDQLSVPPISWSIKGIVDVFKMNFQASDTSARPKPSDIVKTVVQAVRDISPNHAESWSFFAGSYDKPKSELTYFSAGRREPLFLRRSGVICNELSQSVADFTQTHSGLNIHSSQNAKDKTLEIKPGDVILMLPGNASICGSERHQLFHSILFRRLATLDPKLSAIQIRDSLKDLKSYYYQNQSFDRDLCILILESLSEKQKTLDGHSPSSLAS